MRTAMVRGGQLVAIAAATVGAWAAWLSWDHGYQTDQATGVVSGPYEWWQVTGVVLTLGVLAFVGGRLLHPLLLVPTMVIAFTAAWSVPASAADQTGLWAVGAILVAGGTGLGVALVSAPTWHLRHHTARR